MNSSTREPSSRFARWRLERGARTDLPQCVFVDPAEFVRLATSWRKLERRNEPDCDVAGLYDPATGEWFVIEENRLSEALDARA